MSIIQQKSTSIIYNSSMSPVTRSEMIYAGIYGLIAMVLWCITGVLFISEWDVSEDVQTANDIARFHKIMSSPKEKSQITMGCFFLYCSIPLTLSKRYLAEYFGIHYPWS
eukprot:395879_1